MRISETSLQYVVAEQGFGAREVIQAADSVYSALGGKREHGNHCASTALWVENASMATTVVSSASVRPFERSQNASASLRVLIPNALAALTSNCDFPSDNLVEETLADP